MRLTDLRLRMQQEEIASLLVTNPLNVRYLIGYQSSLPSVMQVGHFFDPEVFLLITHDEIFILADSRNSGLFEKTKFNVHVLASAPVADEIVHVIHRVIPHDHTIGIEYRSLTYEDGLALKRGLGGYEVVDCSSWIITQRQVKEESELDQLRRAAQMTDEVFTKVLPELVPGVTEYEIAYKIEESIRSVGMQLSFPTIVASGAGSAVPHYHTSGKKIVYGDTVLLDFGAVYEGYHADMTRTVFVGEPSTRMRQVYEAVLAAQEEVIRNLHIGMTGDEAYDISGAALGKYAKYFTHSLGHGVGLAIHELPSLTARSPHVLTEGMVFTVEPGVYLPGIGGVRIEDLVVMTADGPEVLSQSPKELTKLDSC